MVQVEGTGLSEKRKGEIAYMLLLYRAGKEGIFLNPNSCRELGNIAKAIGVPHEELKEFVREVIKNLTGKFMS